jgi:transcriptional regulator with XRE-family HTH domain
VSDPNQARPHGNALAQLRTSAELSPSAAAEHLGIEESELSDIERGVVQASTSLLADMAKLYQANPHVLVKAYLADQRR